MMLKTFFLSQVAHAIALPENAPGDTSYLKMDSGVTGMAPLSEYILRQSADGHGIERKNVGRLLKQSNRRNTYQRALEKSTLGKVAVLGCASLVTITSIAIGIMIAPAFQGVKLNLVASSIIPIVVMMAIASVLYITTIIFALLHATGWFWWNTIILVGAHILHIAQAIYLGHRCRVMQASPGTPIAYNEILSELINSLDPREQFFILVTLLASTISSIGHTFGGIIVPTFRLVF